MDAFNSGAAFPWVWVGLVAGGVAAGLAGAWWYRRAQRRRVAHFLFTPLPCSFHPATFDSPKSVFDVAWDLGVSQPTLDLLAELRLLPQTGRPDYAELDRTLQYFVQQLGGYRNFIYRCQEHLRGDVPALPWDDAQLAQAETEATAYIGAEEARLEDFVGNPTGLLQNRMVAYLYDDAKTAHARKFGLALAFDYQSFQLLKRCAARDIADTSRLLTHSGTADHDAGVRGAQIKALASGSGVAALEMTKAGAAEGAAVASGLGADAAAQIAAEGGALAAGELGGVLSLGHIAGQFVPIVQAVVLVYGAVHIGHILWKKGQKSNTWLRERKLRGLQKRLGDLLDALYARYESLRGAGSPNAGPFAPAHELLALCEFEEQRLATFQDEAAGRTGQGDVGLLRAHLSAHAVEVSRGLSKGLAAHLKELIAETDARLQQGNKAEAALHLFLNKDLVFPPEMQAELATREISSLAAEVAAEVRRLNSAE